MEMKKSLKISAAALLSLGMLATWQVPAFAWSCQAQANDGTYGYSYNYSNRRDARRRAKADCEARTYDECYIVDCQSNG